MGYGTAHGAQNLSAVDPKLPRSSVPKDWFDLSDDRYFPLEELRGVPPPRPIVLCMLQCGINTSSDHPCFEAIVVFFFPHLYFLVCTLTLFPWSPCH